ncbi:MAG: hypothetical protein Q7R95_06500 [bacterium]|nr:hypothetical protein [bacterium]
MTPQDLKQIGNLFDKRFDKIDKNIDELKTDVSKLKSDMTIVKDDVVKLITKSFELEEHIQSVEDAVLASNTYQNYSCLPRVENLEKKVFGRVVGV